MSLHQASREGALPVGLGPLTNQRIWLTYAELILEGYELNPEPVHSEARGRPKRGKALNLLHRLEEYPGEIMGFIENPDVPYDNNQAERDLRMMKVHEKISGHFCSEEHGGHFSAIRSIISSARKQGRNLLASIGRLFVDPDSLGTDLAGYLPE